MNFKIYLVIIFLLALGSCQTKEQNKPSNNVNNRKVSPVVMAYYTPGKDFQAEKVPVEKLTHIIFSFTHVIDGEMQFGNPEESGKKLNLLIEQKKRNSNLKIMVACGGWGADGFSDMASTPEGREKFIKSTYELVEKYQLDGIDIDWEYPAIPAAGTGARPEDTQNFTLLLKGLREALDATDRPQTLSFASAGWIAYYDKIELMEVLKYIDYMNIMTYDQVSGVSDYTGHHTPLGHVSREEIEGTPFASHLDSLNEFGEFYSDTDPRSVEKIIDFLLAQGANPQQLVIGAAFYGRAWKGVPPVNNGLYQLSGGIHIGWSVYSHIRKTFEQDANYIRYWDDNAKAAYMYNAKDSIFISYEDTVSLRLKTEYAIEKNLGGIMFWQLGDDTKEEGSLLDAIYDATK